MTHMTMSVSNPPDRAVNSAPLAFAGVALAWLCVIVSVIVGVVALGSGLGMIALPFEMWLLDQRLPAVFRVHMVASAIALLMLPIAFAARHQPRLHRSIGWVLGAFVVAGGLTALPVAIISSSSLAARAGFFVQGIVWLALFAAAIAAIRRGDRHRHVVFMMSMAAVATGAVWFRLMTGTAILLDGPFETVYALASWLGWIMPLSLVIVFQDRLVRAAFSRRSPPLARPAPIV